MMEDKELVGCQTCRHCEQVGFTHFCRAHPRKPTPHWYYGKPVGRGYRLCAVINAKCDCPKYEPDPEAIARLERQERREKAVKEAIIGRVLEWARDKFGRVDTP